MIQMRRTGTGGSRGPGGLGRPAGPELVRSLMRELGLEPCQPRSWRFSLTEGDGQEHDIPDLVRRDFTARAPGERWSVTLLIFRPGRAGFTWLRSSIATRKL